MLIDKGDKLGNLYVFEGHSEVGAAMVVEDNKEGLWHQRLGHMNQKGLNVMLTRNQLPRLKAVDLGFCEHCLYGKQKRVSFLKTSNEKKGTPLELVHSDVFGPTEVTSIRGANYFVTFLHDYTRKVWIYMLAKKSEVFSKFKSFKALVENQIGHKIKCLKTDNGGEFFSSEFDSFCADNGIRRIKVVPFTPQENGATERLNRMILEKA